MASQTQAPDPGALPAAMIEHATAMADWVVILPVVLCLIGGALLLIMRKSRIGQAGLAILVTIGVIASDIALLMRTLDGPVSMTMGKWLPPFGIAFTADVLSAGFALAAAVATLVVLFYTQAELQLREVRHGFHALVLLMLAGVSGAFLTGDIFNLYVWFEVMLIASFGLMIMGGRKIQLDAAVKYGFLNFLATTFFLVALGYLYGLVGTLNMADIVTAAAVAPKVPMAAIASLMLLAFGMKAAAFPVNAWLPASYHAPDPGVSALFAGLLTKVGAYTLLRILVALMPGTRDWLGPVLVVVATTTLIIAPLGALAQTNLRRALGFFVIGGIGAILAGLAIGTPTGIQGGAIYAFNSMLVMTAFYLVAGLVERVTGEMDTRQMGGLYAVNSPLSIAFLVLVFAAAGLPPSLAFWPKLLLVEGSVASGQYWVLAAVLINSILTSIAGSRLWAHIFWRQGRAGTHSEQPNDRLRPLSPTYRGFAAVPTGALVLAIVLLGLWPNPVFEAGRLAATGLVDPVPYVAATGLAPANDAAQGGAAMASEETPR
ncbi:MAG: Na+/H+ antiporter subunit D [Alphaproteobacteria bacterium]|nr:Na+/H+ antiporter subunit D [Alphaproteobacteria bacterium]